MVLGTSEGEHLLVESTGATGNDLCDLGGSNESDSLNLGVVNQGSDGFNSSVDNVDNTIGKTGLLEELDHAVDSEGDLLGRLEDVGVSASNGDGESPEGNHGREVERHDRSDNSEGTTLITASNSTADLQKLALDELGHAESILDGLVTLVDIAKSLGLVLSMLEDNNISELVRMLHHELVEADEDLNTTLDGQSAPAYESLGSGLDSGLNVAGVREGNLSDDGAVMRRSHIHVLSGFGLDILVIDVVVHRSEAVHQGK